MITLSVKQPWAYLICAGIKNIENRTWTCPEKRIGQRILIHAAADIKGSYKNLNKKQFDAFMDNQTLLTEAFPFAEELPRSAIIGSVEIVGQMINYPSIWGDSTDEIKCQPLIYNWVLANPILFEKPILNVKGKLRFWEYELPDEYEKLLK